MNNNNGIGGGGVSGNTTSMDCYEDVFKEITKKLYGTEDGLALISDSGDAPGGIIYDDGFRTDASGAITFVSANGLPPGTIVIQRRVQDDKILTQDQLALSNSLSNIPIHGPVVLEERWFESDDLISWTSSKIARYNPAQKVFRCVDCDFVGFLSRVAEHWLGNHASLRVFQCPRCPYTSAWARCVRMHMSKQHGEVLTDNSLWKENPVLEEVTKFLTSLKLRVERKADDPLGGEKRYICQFCAYATDRRDLFNRHENIHRDEKPFKCFVCEKQFNRADHVKKHFMRMHPSATYDINKIRKHVPKSFSNLGGTGVSIYKSQFTNRQMNAQSHAPQVQESSESVPDTSLILQGSNMHYFTSDAESGEVQGALQPLTGVGGEKKPTKIKTKGQKKKKVGEKMYTCSYCPWQGVDNWCLKRHLNTHIKPFLCALCDYKAARSERLSTHVFKVHNKRVCHKCPFLADDPESLAQHVQDSHLNPLVKTGYNCNLCQEYFELRADLEAHAILEHQKVIVQCDLCDYRTTDEMSMESHLREKHNLQPGMGAVAAAAAAAAAAVVNTTHHQQQHQLLVHHEEQVRQIEERESQMRLELPPPLPILQHPTPKTEIEGERQITEQPEPLKHDLTSYHIDETISSVSLVQQVDPDDGTSGEKDVMCPYCGVEFMDESSRKVHERSHEPKRSEPPELRNSKIISRHYTCSTCSYNSATCRIMMQHQRTHTGSELKCRLEPCSFTTPFENSLKEHINGDHKHFGRCPHCATNIISLIDFTLHWKSHHGSVCSLCVEVYKTMYGMKEPEINEFLIKNPQEMLDFTRCLSDGTEDRVPLAKRPREELSPVLTSITNLINHPSLSFLPKFYDISVSKVPSASLKNHKKKSWEKDWTHRTTREKVVRHSLRRLISTNKAHPLPLLLTRRRYGSYKCSACTTPNSPRFNRRVNLLLHEKWAHGRRRTQCDNCEATFRYLYQAILHSASVHGSKESHNNNNLPKIIYKQE